MRVISLIAWICLSTGLTAQSFSAWPAAVLDRELAFNEANECYIYFDHPAGDTLHLKWRQLEVSLPEGWTADLCDYGLCYTGIPANGTMNPAIDTVLPFLKLIVQPNAVSGNAWLWFRAIEVGNNSNFVDVYYNLFTPGTVGVQTPATAPLRFFPNPAGNTLFVENKAAMSLPVRLTDMSGREIWRSILTQYTTETIDLAPYPAGTYLLRTPEKTEPIFKHH